MVTHPRPTWSRTSQNLEPTLDALADIGSDLGDALAYATHFPFTQDIIDRGIRGDYTNFYAVVDLTYPRLRRGLFLGTRWGQPGAPLVPAPGDPGNLNYTYDPMVRRTPPPAAPAPERRRTVAMPHLRPMLPSNAISTDPEHLPAMDQGGG